MLKLSQCRQDILAFLVGRDGSTNADVGLHFKKTNIWANKRLRELYDRGYLTAYAEQRGRGRPTNIYKLAGSE